MKLITLIYLLPVFADFDLTDADNQRIIEANLGDRINIVLNANNIIFGPQFQWYAPDSSNSSILVKMSSITQSNGDAKSIFTAVYNGSVELNSRKSCKPVINIPCLFPNLIWKVTVNVR
jgi:hypothetical protein